MYINIRSPQTVNDLHTKHIDNLLRLRIGYDFTNYYQVPA